MPAAIAQRPRLWRLIDRVMPNLYTDSDAITDRAAPVRKLDAATLRTRFARHPVQVFLDHWTDLRGTEAMPARQTFRPMAVPRLLPYLAILVREDPGADGRPVYRFRLVGEAVRSLHGRAMKDRTLNESLEPDDLAERLKAMEAVYGQQQPFVGLRSVPLPDRRFIRVLHGLFPFADNPGPCLYLIAAPPEVGV